MERQGNLAAKLDFHNHVIPGVDDGAASLEESLSGIRTMAAQGIDRIITTPHLRASLLRQRSRSRSYLDEVDKSWTILSERALRDVPEVGLWRGFEILLDVPEVDVGDPELRLAGSKFVLVEFPFLSIPPQSGRALEAVKHQGYEPILAHPERYVDVQETTSLVREWLSAGARLQVNAGSLVGRYGAAAEKTAWRLLESGLASYVCSDYHSVGVCDTERAFHAVLGRSDSTTGDLLFSLNPARILSSVDPLQAAPIPHKRRGIARIWPWRKG